MKIALLAPNLRGHRDFWLERTLLNALKQEIQVVLYTRSGEIQPERMRDIGLSPENLILEETQKSLIDRWKSDVRREKSLGVAWDADQILFELILARGKYRLLILRPYLEGKNLAALTRYLIKQSLITIISLRRSIEIARLSIPFASAGSKSYYWVRDDYNTEGFLDYVENSQIPVELSEVSNAARIISVAGDMDVRKNPLQAYSVFEEFRNTTVGDVYLVFAGVQKQSFKEELLKIQSLKRVIQIDRMLTSNELAGLLRISIATILIYDNRGASGIALNSLVAGTPVLLKGGKKWENLQSLTGGDFRVETKNSKQPVLNLPIQRSLQSKSFIQILTSEPIPLIGDFILGIEKDDPIKNGFRCFSFLTDRNQFF